MTNTLYAEKIPPSGSIESKILDGVVGSQASQPVISIADASSKESVSVDHMTESKVIALSDSSSSLTDAFPMKPQLASGKSCGTPKTIADLLSRLKDDPQLSKEQKRDRMSALTRLCSYAGKMPLDVLADGKSVQLLIKNLNPVYCGISLKSFRNMRSLVRQILRDYCRSSDWPKAGSKAQRTKSWSALIQAAQDLKIRVGLSRFSSYCSANGWEPNDVIQDHISSFARMLEEDALLGLGPINGIPIVSEI